MGVNGLWKAVEPVGRRVDIATLRGRVLAVDVSIWLVQFIKAMRDEVGNTLPDTHILGMLRRICKLLFHRIRPIFVFDGGAPALKKRVVAERRMQRERQAERTRAMAHKLLLRRVLEMKKAGTLNTQANSGGTLAATSSSDNNNSKDLVDLVQSDSESDDGIDASIAIEGTELNVGVLQTLPLQKQYEAISKEQEIAGGGRRRGVLSFYRRQVILRSTLNCSSRAF